MQLPILREIRLKSTFSMPRLHQAWIDYDTYSRIRSGELKSHVFSHDSYVSPGDRIKFYSHYPHWGNPVRIVLSVTNVWVVRDSQSHTDSLVADFRILS